MIEQKINFCSFISIGFSDERGANDVENPPIGHLPAENAFNQPEYKRSDIAPRRSRRSLEDDEDEEENDNSDEDPDEVGYTR